MTDNEEFDRRIEAIRELKREIFNDLVFHVKAATDYVKKQNQQKPMTQEESKQETVSKVPPPHKPIEPENRVVTYRPSLKSMIENQLDRDYVIKTRHAHTIILILLACNIGISLFLLIR